MADGKLCCFVTMQAAAKSLGIRVALKRRLWRGREDELPPSSEKHVRAIVTVAGGPRQVHPRDRSKLVRLPRWFQSAGIEMDSPPKRKRAREDGMLAKFSVMNHSE